ncbi:Poly [ADP-ribose] polymerase 2 [Perkinsus chesapeaki]|uniref:Poly [ADP-ribose] polymerase n=1 Tax=Perkinsus chesapeaki TaxID=330153 RepID=A0A7J6MSK6_PERCH|nr:Poly [ADP-ribose] polymerase 2 [Perkinsus chesapeaki]
MTERRSARVAAQVAARAEVGKQPPAVASPVEHAKPRAKTKAKAKAKAEAAVGEPPTKRGKIKVEDEEVEKKRADTVKAKPGKKKAKPEKPAVARPPVDEHCPKADQYRVYIDEEGIVWHALLNQTNLKQNNNKYFKIQVLEDTKKCGHYIAWFRWGRVGYTGQMTSKGSNLEEAKEAFEKKFADKTLNDWHAVATGQEPFSPRANKYTYVEQDFSGGPQEEPPKKGDEAKPEIKVEDTKLDEQVYELIRMICDRQLMVDHMKASGVDVNKMPLGKISEDMIKKGYEALQAIEEELAKPKPSRSNLLDLSGRFYTVVPHDFGFQKMHYFVIDSADVLKQKMQLLEDLQDMGKANEVMDDNMPTAVKGEEPEVTVPNPVDVQYQRLHCDLEPLKPEDEEFKMIEGYMRNTHAPTHDDFTAKPVAIFKARKGGEEEQWAKECPKEAKKDRMLLWHGSRLTNWCGILSSGLRIAPPEAPVTGYMFGKGLYFADSFSKSANYCFATQNKRVMKSTIQARLAQSVERKALNVVVVALGRSRLCTEADSRAASKLGKGKNACYSTKGVGRSGPDPKDLLVTKDGLKVPLGKMIELPEEKDKQLSLLYNEYIVYNTSQSSCDVEDCVEGPVANFSHRGLSFVPILDFRATLVGLYLQDNKLIGELPHLGKLPHLRDLDLSDNLLSGIPEYSLEGCTTLARVSLANNRWLVSVRGLHEVRRTLRALNLSCCPRLANMWPVGFSLKLAVLVCDSGELSEVQEYMCHVQPRGMCSEEEWLYSDKLERLLERPDRADEGYHYDTYTEPDVTPRGYGSGLCVKSVGCSPPGYGKKCCGSECLTTMDGCDVLVEREVVDCSASVDSWDMERDTGPTYTSGQVPVFPSELPGTRGFEYERARTVSDARFMQGLPRCRDRGPGAPCCGGRRGPRPALTEMVDYWEEDSADRMCYSGLDLTAAGSCERSRRCLIFAARLAEVCSGSQYRNKAMVLAELLDNARGGGMRKSSYRSHPPVPGGSEVLEPLGSSGHAYDTENRHNAAGSASYASGYKVAGERYSSGSWRSKDSRGGSSNTRSQGFEYGSGSGKSYGSIGENSRRLQGAMVHHHVKDVDVVQVGSSGQAGERHERREYTSIREGNSREGSGRGASMELQQQASGRYHRSGMVSKWGSSGDSGGSIEVLPSQGRSLPRSGSVEVLSSMDRSDRHTVGGSGGRGMVYRSREIVSERQGAVGSGQAYRHERWERTREGDGRLSGSRGSVEVLPSRADRSTEVLPSRAHRSTGVLPSRAHRSTEVLPSRAHRSTEVLASRPRGSAEVLPPRHIRTDERQSTSRGGSIRPGYHHEHYHERVEIKGGTKPLVVDESVDISRVEETAPAAGESVIVEDAPPPLASMSDRQVRSGAETPPAKSLSDRRDERPSLLTMPYRSALSNREEDTLLKLHEADRRE